MFAFVAWMLVSLPVSLLASWEVPASTRAGQAQRWTYTPTSQIATHTDATGAITSNAHDERDQLLSRSNY